jgi:hypothetical protein
MRSEKINATHTVYIDRVGDRDVRITSGSDAASRERVKKLFENLRGENGTLKSTGTSGGIRSVAPYAPSVRDQVAVTIMDFVEARGVSLTREVNAYIEDAAATIVRVVRGANLGRSPEVMRLSALATTRATLPRLLSHLRASALRL